MKYIALLLPLLFAGCSVITPVKRNFPEAPKIESSCQDLQLVKDGALFSELLSTVSSNYGQYHECRAKMDAWNEWYKTQKQIFDSVK